MLRCRSSDRRAVVLRLGDRRLPDGRRRAARAESAGRVRHHRRRRARQPADRHAAEIVQDAARRRSPALFGSRARRRRTTSSCWRCCISSSRWRSSPASWRSRRTSRSRPRARSCRSTRSSWRATTRVDFLADSIKVIIVGGIAAHDLESLMDEDLEVHHHEALRPAATLNKVGDALPGLGIVAAVLGVVITMGAHRRAAGRDRPQGRRRARRHVPRHSAVVRLRRSRSPATSSSACRRGAVLRAVHQGRPAGDLQGPFRRRLRSSSRAACCPTTCGRPSTRPRSSAARRPRQPTKRRRPRPWPADRHQPVIIVKKKRARPRRPPRRRVEGGLRRLRDRDDGVLPGDVAGRPEQVREGGGRRLLPRSGRVRRGSGRRPAGGMTWLDPGHRPRRCPRPATTAVAEAQEVLEQAAQRIARGCRAAAGFHEAQGPDRVRGDRRRAAHRAARDGERAASSTRQRRAARRRPSSSSASSRTSSAVQQRDRGRRPHRQPAVRGRERLHELGAVGRPRQRRAPRDAAEAALAADAGRSVRGYADRQLRVADDPLDPRNRRVSIVVHNS